MFHEKQKMSCGRYICGRKPNPSPYVTCVSNVFFKLHDSAILFCNCARAYLGYLSNWVLLNKNRFAL
jgi:hypothetical protein